MGSGLGFAETNGDPERLLGERVRVAERTPLAEEASVLHERPRPDLGTGLVPGDRHGRPQDRVTLLPPPQELAGRCLPQQDLDAALTPEETGECEGLLAEIEQAAFAPSNKVPGIGYSPDKMLQARVFSYADAHRYRLGTHYEALPVNAPKAGAATYHKDGPMRFFPNGTNPDAYYEPNSFGGPVESPDAKEPPLPLAVELDNADKTIDADTMTELGDH